MTDNQQKIGQNATFAVLDDRMEMRHKLNAYEKAFRELLLACGHSVDEIWVSDSGCVEFSSSGPQVV